MTGNRVLLFFRNTTELGDCCNLGYDVSKWPNNFEGTKMHDGVAVLIGARVFIENDSIPVTDMGEIQSRNDLDTLYYIQSSFRVYLDTDPVSGVEWGLEPVFGYFNEVSEYPAMSNIPGSWPAAGWPARGNTLKWPGEWNGGGLLIDNPGIREVQLWGAEGGLQASFDDIEALSVDCRFRDCEHQSEPGCAVLEAVEKGRMAPERLENYRALQRELLYLARKQDEGAERAGKRRWKIIQKAYRKSKKLGHFE